MGDTYEVDEAVDHLRRGGWKHLFSKSRCLRHSLKP